MTPFTPARLREIANWIDTWGQSVPRDALRFAAEQGEELENHVEQLRVALEELKLERATIEQLRSLLTNDREAHEAALDIKHEKLVDAQLALIRERAAHEETRWTLGAADLLLEQEKSAHEETNRRLAVADKMLNELSVNGAIQDWLKASASR